MSRILWIEDFEGDKYREFSSALFSDALSIFSDEFPNSRVPLREFLSKENIILKTTFVEASRYINESIHKIDAVIIDIDLNLFREDIKLAPDKDPKQCFKEYLGEQTWLLLTHWHNFDPDSNDWEKSFETARAEMRKIAGYHLFIDLVINKRFPKEHIIFASNHFEYISSIRDSFKIAKIDPPKALSKDKAADLVEVCKWICGIRNQSYLQFRRWVTEGCEYCLNKLKSDPNFYALSTLDKSHVVITIESLRYILPEHFIESNAKASTYRVFVRVLTQAFEEKFAYDTLTGDERAWPRLSYFWTLKNCRNWTSHDSQALTVTNEGDIIFIFLIAMRFFFKLNDNLLAKYETELFSFFDKANSLDEKNVEEICKINLNELNKRCQIDKISLGKKHLNSCGFSFLANELKVKGRLAQHEIPKILSQIFYGCLVESLGGHLPSSRLQQNKFVQELTYRTFARSYDSPILPESNI